jgi:hypothetical protein
LGTVKEIDRKFNTGHSRFDNPDEELLLGDKIDIKRIIRTVPSVDDYKSI